MKTLGRRHIWVCTVCLGGIISGSALFAKAASYLGLHCLRRQRHIWVCTVCLGDVISGSALFA